MIKKILSFLRGHERLEEFEKEQKLRASGRVFHFGFDDCLIKPFTQIEEKERSAALEIRMLDGLAGKDQMQRNTIESCRIVCRYIKEGMELEFVSPLLRKDRATLSFLLYHNGGLNVFANPDKLDEYSFDLEFLK